MRRARDGGRVVVGERRQHDREFVAAEARHDVIAAHLVLQAESHLLEQRVAEVMSERIVHFFEAIEIHQHQRQLRAADARGVDGLLQHIEEQRPVRQAGQAHRAWPDGAAT